MLDCTVCTNRKIIQVVYSESCWESSEARSSLTCPCRKIPVISGPCEEVQDRARLQLRLDHLRRQDLSKQERRLSCCYCRGCGRSRLSQVGYINLSS
ncbi:hypothetical protein J6590_091054 [Homalodisca vitripennis]|nr:hypothetical protein J6590_091054 [Homalodisca vitripennis]